MYTKEQKERALKEFERLGSVQAVVTLLGYPSRHTLYDWYRNKIADYHGSLQEVIKIEDDEVGNASQVAQSKLAELNVIRASWYTPPEQTIRG